MLGKPEWFERRKYWGWGISPKTWQGWVYLFIIIVPFMVIQSLFDWNNEARIIVTLIWLFVVLIDVLDIMIRLKKDEREAAHEAIAERNALWAMMIALVLGLSYQIAKSAALGIISGIDPFIVGALLAATITKTVTNFYLDKKD